MIREATERDVDAIAAINAAGVPGVTPADRGEVARLLRLSTVALVAVDDLAHVHGFALLVAPGVDYESENYRWFVERGTDFLYVDRIAVAEHARGRGVGAELYAAVFDAARERGHAEVTCEVNTLPPNPGSMRFHQRLGFEPVGALVTKGGAYEVVLLARPIPTGP